MRCAQRIIAFGSLALVVGCGRVSFDAPGPLPDAGADAPIAPPDLDFNPYGHWRVDTVHVTGGSSRMSDDLVNGFRGDLWFATDGTFRSRALILQASVPVDQNQFGGTTAYGDHEYTLSIAGSPVVAVYGTTVIDADHVHAVWKSGDPRNADTPTYDVFDIVRTPDLPAEIIGSQTIARLAFETIPEFATGSCLDMGGTSSRITGTNVIDENFIVTTHAVFDTYDGGACAGQPTEDVSDSVAFLDASGSSYTLWSTVDGTNVVRMTGDITISPTTYRFSRTTCELDLTECANDLTEMVVPR